MYSASWIYIKYQFQHGLFKKKKSVVWDWRKTTVSQMGKFWCRIWKSNARLVYYILYLSLKDFRNTVYSYAIELAHIFLPLFFFFFINWNTVRIRKTTEATFVYYLHDLKRTNKLRFHGALQCLFLHFARKATKDKDASIRDIDPTTRTTPRFCIRENVAK